MAIQGDHGLHVVGLGKQVERLHHSDAIAEGLQLDEIAGQSGGIARHVDDSCGPGAGNSPHDLSPSAGSRRIEHHHARSPMFGQHLGQDTAGVTGKKAGVVQAIAVGIGTRRLDRAGRQLDAHRLGACRGQRQGEHAHATVEVDG